MSNTDGGFMLACSVLGQYLRPHIKTGYGGAVDSVLASLRDRVIEDLMAQIELTEEEEAKLRSVIDFYFLDQD